MPSGIEAILRVQLYTWYEYSNSKVWKFSTFELIKGVYDGTLHVQYSTVPQFLSAESLEARYIGLRLYENTIQY